MSALDRRLSPTWRRHLSHLKPYDYALAVPPLVKARVPRLHGWEPLPTHRHIDTRPIADRRHWSAHRNLDAFRLPREIVGKGERSVSTVADFGRTHQNERMKITAVHAELHVFDEKVNYGQPIRFAVSFDDGSLLRLLVSGDGSTLLVDRLALEPAMDMGKLAGLERSMSRTGWIEH